MEGRAVAKMILGRYLTRRLCFYIVFLAMLLCFIVLSSAAEARRRPASKRKLSLTEAINIATSKSHAARGLRLSRETSVIGYQDAWDSMFLPSVNLSFSTQSTYTLGRIPGTDAADAGQSTRAYGYPSTSLGISIGEYTLFNFGKDRNSWEGTRLGFERSEEAYYESRRGIRHGAINAYFGYHTAKEREGAAKRSVTISKALLELTKSRLRIGKATKVDVSSSTIDVITAKKAYLSARTATKSALWALNQVLGHKAGVRYRLITELKFVPVKVRKKWAIKKYMADSPAMKDASLSVKTAELALEMAELNRLPLPTVTISGLAVTYTNDYYGSPTATANALSTTAGTSSGNIDVTASVSLTLPLYGPGGLFNNRSIRSTEIGLTLAENSFDQAKLGGIISMRTQVQGLKDQEEQISLQQEQLTAAAQVLNSMMVKMRTKSVDRLELRDAITQARSAELDLADSILGHIGAKLSLAAELNMDKLPKDKY